MVLLVLNLVLYDEILFLKFRKCFVLAKLVPISKYGIDLDFNFDLKIQEHVVPF